ncbi:insulinase family protein [bacterium]|nr:insulinase family protein [bacterium]
MVEASWASKYTSRAPTEASPQKRVLPGGVSLIVHEDHTDELVAVHIWIAAGSRDETDDIRGTSHFIEHLVFKGTAARGPGQIDRELDALGAENNALTSYDFTAYTVIGPSSAFSAMLEVQVDMVLNPAFDPIELEKEREIILEEIRQEEDIPQSVQWDMLTDMAYPNHPYRLPIIGTVASIKEIPRKSIVEYHRTMYVPANITVVVTGDVREDAVAKEVEKAFSQCVSFAPPSRKVVLEMSNQNQRRQAKEMDVTRSYLALGYPGVSASERDFFALEVAAAFLGQGPGSYLVHRLKDELALVDSIECQNWAPRSRGLIIIEAVMPPENLEAVEMALIRELEAVKSMTPGENEFKRARAVALAHHLFQTETYDQKAEMIGALDNAASLQVFDKYNDHLRSVTSADLERVFKKYLTLDNDSIAIIKPAKAGFEPVKAGFEPAITDFKPAKSGSKPPETGGEESR